MLSKEESVGHMGQSLHPRRRGRLVVMKDVPIRYRMGEFVGNMGLKLIGRLAVMKDVPIMHRREEFVSVMGPRGRLANMKGVPTMHRKEEFVSDMVQWVKKYTCSYEGCNTAMFRREEYVLDTVQIIQRELRVFHVHMQHSIAVTKCIGIHQLFVSLNYLCH